MSTTSAWVSVRQAQSNNASRLVVFGIAACDGRRSRNPNDKPSGGGQIGKARRLEKAISDHRSAVEGPAFRATGRRATQLRFCHGTSAKPTAAFSDRASTNNKS